MSRVEHKCMSCGSSALLEPAARSLPHSEEAERAVIGTVLLYGGKAFAEVSGSVLAEDFFIPGHRSVFLAMEALDAERKPIDGVTVVDALRLAGEEEKIRSLGIGFIETVTAYAGIETISHHARKVREYSEMRRLGAMLVELAATVYSGAVNHADAFEQADREFMALTTQRRRAGGPIDTKAGMRRVIKNVEARWQRRSEGFAVTAVPTGLSALDEATCGLRPGQLVVLAGRPGAGKTALMGNIEENASDAGVACLSFSLEMPTDEKNERLIASNGVSSDNLRSGHMTQGDFIAMTKTAARLAEQNRIWTDDASDVGSISLMELRSRARRWRMHEAAKHERILITVDYLQLIKGSGRKDNRQEEVAEVSRGLKALAKELQCPVLALSQLNRAGEQRQNKRPTMGELRESGQIEQDADIILFLYRDELHNPESERKGIAELNIAKHRGGPTGMVELGWNAKQTRFVNLSHRSEA